ncbi:MAG: SDR family oxidoreductase [Chitinophagales bacterium]|nr:SDR family oxidoreductase [Chitinophagales bacterium]
MSKTILISGASRGIGLAIARLFWNKGWNVALCARNVEGLKKEFITQERKSAFIQSLDVKDKKSITLFAEEAIKQFAAVDVLVNNAGQFLPGKVHDEPDGTLEHLIETNLYSAYYLSRALVTHMKERKTGSIYNICSVASLFAYPNGGSYSISKFAMLGLSKALREELKSSNIKVTALLPGATLTDSWAGAPYPESRFMKAEDIAQIIWDIEHLSPNTVVEEVLLRPVLGDI